MGKVTFLREQNRISFIKEQYKEAEFHLNETRRLNAIVESLREAHFKLSTEEHELRMRGILAYLDSEAEELYKAKYEVLRLKEEEIRRLSLESLDKGTAILDWVKKEFS